MNEPATLDHAGIAARVPHAGTMCLLDRLLDWTKDEIRCGIVNHRNPAHPLGHGGLLPAAAAVEYASQAMALHGHLCAAAGTPPAPGFLASVRGGRLCVPRLDDVAGELTVSARRLLGDAGQAQYQFALHDSQGRLLAEGRATVILNALPKSA